MSNGPDDLTWTKDYEPWQFAYCFYCYPRMDQSIKNHKEIYDKMKSIPWNNSVEAIMFEEGWKAAYNKALEAIDKVQKNFKELFFE
jgi:hypothetical protein